MTREYIPHIWHNPCMTENSTLLATSRSVTDHELDIRPLISVLRSLLGAKQHRWGLERDNQKVYQNARKIPDLAGSKLS